MALTDKRVKDTIEALKNFELAGARVGLLRSNAEEVSKGGIIIPDMAQRKEARGVVVVIGQGYGFSCRALGVAGLKVGMWATFNSYDGVLHSFRIDGVERKILAMDISQVYFFIKKGVVDGFE